MARQASDRLAARAYDALLVGYLQVQGAALLVLVVRMYDCTKGGVNGSQPAKMKKSIPDMSLP